MYMYMSSARALNFAKDSLCLIFKILPKMKLRASKGDYPVMENLTQIKVYTLSECIDLQNISY